MIALVVFLIFVVAFIVLQWVLGRMFDKRVAKMIEQRPGISICDYGRSFPRREVDFGIARTVHEYFSEFLTRDPKGFPVMVEDRWEDDYSICWEDVHFFVIETLEKTNRSTENPEENPFWEATQTVGGLVQFISRQPLR